MTLRFAQRAKMIRTAAKMTRVGNWGISVMQEKREIDHAFV